MKLKQWLLFLLLSMVSVSLMAEKLVSLEGIFKPFSIAMDDEQLYVAEEVTVSIFSLKDFSLKKKFGKAGEGPQEFMRIQGMSMLMVFPQADSLVINSAGKVSIFTKDGKFIKEIKSPLNVQMMGMFQPIGNRFVGMGIALGENQSMNLTINFYDAQLKKLKEITRQPFLQRGRMEFPMVNPSFFVDDNKIVFGGQQEFVVNVLDENGNKLTAIKRQYKPLKVTAAYKKGVHDTFKTLLKKNYDVMKNRISFADQFPPIQMIYVDNRKVYIHTYLQENDKYEFFIYDLEGKFLKRVMVPFSYLNAFMPCPTTVKHDTLYQLIENEDEETWELHAVKMM